MNALYGMLNGRSQTPSEPRPDARTGKQTQTDFGAAMAQLKANPVGLAEQAGYQIPGDVGNDPQRMVMHLIRSGQVGGPMMRMIQPMLARMGVR